MKFSLKTYLPIIVALAIVLGMYMGQNLNFPDQKEYKSSSKQKFTKFIDYIDESYVDEVNTDSIVELTLKSVLDQLDPHSSYISQQDYNLVHDEMRGGFVGIGVSFYHIGDSLAVIRTIENGPSDKAGLLPGDRIVEADGVDLSSSVVSDSITKLLKGEKNTNVLLKVKRFDEENLLSFNVKRDQVPLKSVDATYLLDDTTAYVKINRFSETTYSEFKGRMQKLPQHKIKSIVLDLRNNTGGYLQEATQIADEFLKEDQLIVFTKNKDGDLNKRFAKSGGAYEDAEIYVLINEKTASASEVIAGAIQDNDRGTIIGRRSFGKGLVQREMQLGDGSAVRLTVARYYTPTGRSIQRSYENGSKDYFSSYLKRYANGELQNADSIHVDESKKFTTPKGKVVYGGGGIIPDIFIPINETQTSKDLKFMFEGGAMSRFIFTQMDKDRAYFNHLNEKQFLTGDLITYEIVNDFENYLGDFSMTYDFSSSVDEAKIYLKATMAQQIFDDNLAYKIINQSDAMLQKITELKTE